MPHLPGRPFTSSSRAAFLSPGWRTSKNRFSRLKPVAARRGSRRASRRWMSSFTSGVAVAVKAPITGRRGREAAKAGMLK